MVAAMSLLPFGELPPHSPRQFVPRDADPGSWDALRPLFDVLEARLGQAASPAELERWLADWSELTSVIDDEGSRRYIAMTCHTENPEAERAYLDFVERLEPEVKPRQAALERLYLAHPARPQLPRQRYEVLDRQVRVRVELFRQENVALETEEARLSQQFQKLSGSLTVPFQGEEQTLVRMNRYLEEPDRGLRQQAWEAVARRRLAEKESFESLFDELLKVRRRLAVNAGYGSYRDYAFPLRGRFDYGPEDCLRFHEAVEREVMPLRREFQARRRQRMGLEALRPWDLNVDADGRPALRPFTDANELEQRTAEVIRRVDPALAAEFEVLREKRLLDLANRAGKAPGGYQSTLSESRLPFIFMNAVGVQRDVETLLHEGGHAFHALASRNEPLFAYRNPPIEFCEVASMSMELLGNEFLEAFYPPEQARRARREHLEGIVDIVPWVATVDAFQHWIYTHPEHRREERGAYWRGLMARFGGDVDWSGHEEAQTHLWHKQLHIFCHPFYYIEYGIAQLGALQVWRHYHQDQRKAVEAYRAALSWGGSRPLPELFGAAGCRFDFSASTIRPLMELIRAEWAALAG